MTDDQYMENLMWRRDRLMENIEKIKRGQLDWDLDEAEKALEGYNKAIGDTGFLD